MQRVKKDTGCIYRSLYLYMGLSLQEVTHGLDEKLRERHWKHPLLHGFWFVISMLRRHVQLRKH